MFGIEIFKMQHVSLARPQITWEPEKDAKNGFDPIFPFSHHFQRITVVAFQMKELICILGTETFHHILPVQCLALFVVAMCTDKADSQGLEQSLTLLI